MMQRAQSSPPPLPRQHDVSGRCRRPSSAQRLAERSRASSVGAREPSSSLLARAASQHWPLPIPPWPRSQARSQNSVQRCFAAARHARQAVASGRLASGAVTLSATASAAAAADQAAPDRRASMSPMAQPICGREFRPLRRDKERSQQRRCSSRAQDAKCVHLQRQRHDLAAS
jgi:hypothetical protein